MIHNSFAVILSIFQPEHMIFILIAILLLFGGKKIPELMRGVGKGMREFKDAKDNVKSEIENGMKETTISDKDEEIRKLREQLEQKQVQQ
jgi:sec-independent protein translocase protein TatA